MLEEHQDELAHQAREMVRAEPGVQPVGMVMETDAPEVHELREAFESEMGRDLGGSVISCLMPRELALEVLRRNAPASLDWLEPTGEGAERRLPLVAVTCDGMRLGAVPYRVD